MAKRNSICIVRGGRLQQRPAKSPTSEATFAAGYAAGMQEMKASTRKRAETARAFPRGVYEEQFLSEDGCTILIAVD